MHVDRLARHHARSMAFILGILVKEPCLHSMPGFTGAAICGVTAITRARVVSQYGRSTYPDKALVVVGMHCPADLTTSLV